MTNCRWSILQKLDRPKKGASKRHHFVESLVLANFKDLNVNVEASFFGPIPIVIPFWKPFASAFQMGPEAMAK